MKIALFLLCLLCVFSGTARSDVVTPSELVQLIGLNLVDFSAVLPLDGSFVNNHTSNVLHFNQLGLGAFFVYRQDIPEDSFIEVRFYPQTTQSEYPVAGSPYFPSYEIGVVAWDATSYISLQSVGFSHATPKILRLRHYQDRDLAIIVGDAGFYDGFAIRACIGECEDTCDDECHGLGLCDVSTQQCLCAPGVSGDSCDEYDGDHNEYSDGSHAKHGDHKGHYKHDDDESDDDDDDDDDDDHDWHHKKRDHEHRRPEQGCMMKAAARYLLIIGFFVALAFLVRGCMARMSRKSAKYTILPSDETVKPPKFSSHYISVEHVDD